MTFPAEPLRESPEKRSYLFLLIIAVFLVYGNAFFNGLSRDDMAIFQALPSVIPSNNFLELCHKIETVLESSHQSGFWRPLTYASFVIDQKIWGPDPFGFHATNIFLHAGVVVLLFILCARLLASSRIGFIIALLYAIHPVHFEAVGLIHNRSDILCLFFLLSSLYGLDAYSRKKGRVLLAEEIPDVRYFVGSLVSFFLALLSKETAVVFPLIVFVYMFLFLRKYERLSALKMGLSFLGVLAIYLSLRVLVLGEIIQAERVWGFYNFPPGEGAFWPLATALKLVEMYFAFLMNSFNPFDFCADYALKPITSLLHGEALLGGLIILILLYLLIRLRKTLPFLSLAIVWFLVTYLPISNIVPIGNLFSQRYMYIPSVGFFVLLGFCFGKLIENKESQKLIAIFLILLIILWGRSTILRNQYYRDDISLWFYTAKHPLASPRAHLVLGQYYIRAGNLNLAKEELEASLNKNSNYIPALMMLGYVSKEQGHWQEAEDYFSRAAGVATQANDLMSLQEALEELKTVQ